jgi:hypothetical protein
MIRKLSLLSFLLTMVPSILACNSEPEAHSPTSVASGLPKFGSEVENNGVKSRLFGCLPEDQDCLRRSEILTQLSCDFVTNTNCSGCSKLDLACLERVARNSTSEKSD